MSKFDGTEHVCEKPAGNGESGQGEQLLGGTLGKRPSMDQWLLEAKAHPSASKVGMYLIHNGTVRGTARASVRGEKEQAFQVAGMEFSYHKEKLEEILAEACQLPGIYYVRAWLNEGRLKVGDDIMAVLVGGDIRPRVVDALQYLVGRIKKECVVERELYEQQ